MTERWYKNAIIYSLDVETFFDSNGDGIGDFQGLIERLDYLAGLGVTCLWLQPFYPTPNRDDGYDVADYYGIDPRLGSPGDFVVFMEEAKQRGFDVIVELVVNHTSTDHPWFQAARSDPTSPYRDYYIWIDEPPTDERRGGPVFPGEQSGNWAYDEMADAYYWHWFYDHQPDLNTGNPAVREEIKKIMGFWLALGVSGFRMDAAPFLFKRKGIEGSNPDNPLAFLKELRSCLVQKRSDAIFLAEADVNSDELNFFLGDGERMHLLFNFILNNHLFLALARQSAEPIERAMDGLPEFPDGSQWANFVRNHDELNLDRLSPEEKEATFEAFAPDPDMRIYGRGIRRRLPPMLHGNRRQMEMVYSLNFACPGAPVIRYGQEIGMGDEQSLPERTPVRTPMQWSSEPSAGFSTASEDDLVRRLVQDPEFAYPEINVDDQRRDPASLLNFFLRLIRTRKECPEVGAGKWEILETGDERVLGLAYRWRGGRVFTFHNLSEESVDVAAPLGLEDATRVADLFGDRVYEPVTEVRAEFSMEGFGYRWLRISPFIRALE